MAAEKLALSNRESAVMRKQVSAACFI